MNRKCHAKFSNFKFNKFKLFLLYGKTKWYPYSKKIFGSGLEFSGLRCDMLVGNIWKQKKIWCDKINDGGFYAC